MNKAVYGKQLVAKDKERRLCTPQTNMSFPTNKRRKMSDNETCRSPYKQIHFKFY